MGLLTSFKAGVEKGKEEEELKITRERVERKAEEIRKKREQRDNPSPIGEKIGRVVARVSANPVANKTAKVAGTVAGKAVSGIKTGVRNYAQANYGPARPKKGRAGKAPPSPFAFGPMGGGGGGMNVSQIGAGLSDDMFMPPPKAARRARRKKRGHEARRTPRDPFDIGPGFL